VLAALSLVLANVVGGLRETVFDRDTFRAAVTGSLDDGEARKALSRRLIRAVYEAAAPDARPHPDLAPRVEGLLARPEVRRAVGAAADVAWFVLVERGDEPIVLDATQARDEILVVLRETDDELATRVAATPTPFVVTLFESDALPTVAQLHGPATRVMIGLLAFGILLLLFAFQLHPVRGGAAQVLLWVAGALSVVLALVFWLLPGVIGGRVQDAELAVVATSAAHSVLRPVLLRCILLAGAIVALMLFRRTALRRMG
jgi:hypothetical protein